MDKFIEAGRKTLVSEAETLNTLAEKLDQNFSLAVQKLIGISGRVVLTGVGKNQFIGKKIASTLNSIGVSSFFMHAGDAVHGDLGMLTADDIAICLSKSGNTPEIKALTPLIKDLGVFLIGISTQPDSHLGKQADLHIYVPVKRESCPLDLTPTNSTTAFLAIGDALAMSLLEAGTFSREDFARFHPGGSLGKTLYLKVSDLYLLNERPAVTPETSIHDTILEISMKRLGATAVLSGDKIKGIITDGDLRRLFQKNHDLKNLSASDALSENPRCISPDAHAFEALALMRSNNITQLLVTEGEQYLGIVHIHDILKEGIV